jgi:hypothetical protein
MKRRAFDRREAGALSVGLILTRKISVLACAGAVGFQRRAGSPRNH